jgi:hypothetical protein
MRTQIKYKYQIDGEITADESYNAFDGYIEFNTYDELVHTIQTVTTKGSLIFCYFNDRSIPNPTIANALALNADTFRLIMANDRLVATYRIPSPSRMVGAQRLGIPRQGMVQPIVLDANRDLLRRVADVMRQLTVVGMLPRNYGNHTFKKNIEFLFVRAIRSYVYRSTNFLTNNMTRQDIDYYKNLIKDDIAGTHLVKNLIRPIINNYLDQMGNRCDACFIGLLIEDVLWESMGIEYEYLTNNAQFHTFQDTLLQLVLYFSQLGNMEILIKFLHAVRYKAYPDCFVEFYTNLCTTNREAANYFVAGIRLAGLLDAIDGDKNLNE